MTDDYVIVKYDYLAQEDKELTIKKNERLLLIDDSENWWKVMNDASTVGFVPSNFVRKESIVDKAKGTIMGLTRPRQKVLDSEQANRFKQTELGFSSPGNNNLCSSDLSIDKEQFNKVLTMATKTSAIVKFAYEPRLDDELRLTKGETVTVIEKSTDGWWKGQASEGTGWFPSNYVDEVSTSNGNQVGPRAVENQQPSISVPRTNPQPVEQSYNEVVLALYEFHASSSEELSFKKGEKLYIIDHPAHDPEWWMARNTQQQTGLVPRNYIEVIENGDEHVVDQRQQGSIKTAAQEPYYFGAITRDEADHLLANANEGEFLVRESESNPGQDMSISMRGTKGNKHFKVKNINGQLQIGTRNFGNMQTLISHYSVNPIFSSQTEKLYLTKPLPR